MYTAAQLVLRMHGALAADSSSLGQRGPPGGSASNSRASSDDSAVQLLQKARDVVEQGQANPREYALPSTKIEQLIQVSQKI